MPQNNNEEEHEELSMDEIKIRRIVRDEIANMFTIAGQLLFNFNHPAYVDDDDESAREFLRSYDVPETEIEQVIAGRKFIREHQKEAKDGD